MIRVALAAGGTAGHVYPAIAVADELTRRGAEVLFLGTSSGQERDLVRQYRIELLLGRPYQRTTLAGKVAAVATIPAAVAASARVLRRERIDAVIGFGGYASIGPVLAARLLGIPTAILEPNAALGMANRLLARVADRIYTGAITQCNSPKARRVGLPVRREIVSQSGKQHHAKATVFLFDGDLSVDIPVIRASQFAHVADAYTSCDLVITRAGAGTLAEISICALPSIIVPLHAAEDHQVLNAEIYARAGAAVVTNADELNERLHDLLADPERLRAIGQRAAIFAAPHAATYLVDDLLQLIAKDEL